MNKKQFKVEQIRKGLERGTKPTLNEVRLLLDTIDELNLELKNWRNQMAVVWDEIHDAGNCVAKAKRSVVKALRGEQ